MSQDHFGVVIEPMKIPSYATGFVAICLSSILASLSDANAQTSSIETQCSANTQTMLEVLQLKDKGYSLEQAEQEIKLANTTDTKIAAFIKFSMEEVYKDPSLVKQAINNGNWQNACIRAGNR